MTKKDFFEKINGCYVTIANKKEIQEKNKEIIKELQEDIKAFNEKFNRKVKIKNFSEGFLKISNGESFRIPSIQCFIVHTSRNLKTIVRSKDLIINNCYFDKKNIIILDNNKFTSVNLQKDNIILEFQEV